MMMNSSYVFVAECCGKTKVYLAGNQCILSHEKCRVHQQMQGQAV
jgi:hypothetical protein